MPSTGFDLSQIPHSLDVNSLSIALGIVLLLLIYR